MREHAHFNLFGALGVILFAASLPGCTFVGAGVGAGIDSLIPGPYEERAIQNVHLSRGQRVIFVSSGGKQVNGRYIGTLAPTPRDPQLYVILDVEGELARIPMNDIASVRVEVPGKGWLYGGVVGLAVDTALVVAVVVAANNVDLHGTSFFSGG